MKNISKEEWKHLTATDANKCIIDVRTAEEVEDGVIKGVDHLFDIYQGGGFIDAVKELDKTKNIYVYCRSGNRSAQACQVLEQLGFENTFNLEGGITEWDGDIVKHQ